MPTPYAEHVGDRDPVDVLRESLDHYRDVVSGFPPASWQTRSAPGKWTAHEILVHVSQWEMIFGGRLRCGLGVPGYVVQPIDQDRLMAEADVVDTPAAFAAFEGARRMNLALAASLSREARLHTLQHPERGTIDVEDILVTLAGHSVHHLKQLRRFRAPAMSDGLS